MCSSVPVGTGLEWHTWQSRPVGRHSCEVSRAAVGCWVELFTVYCVCSQLILPRMLWLNCGLTLCRGLSYGQNRTIPGSQTLLSQHHQPARAANGRRPARTLAQHAANILTAGRPRLGGRNRSGRPHVFSICSQGSQLAGPPLLPMVRQPAWRGRHGWNAMTGSEG